MALLQVSFPDAELLETKGHANRLFASALSNARRRQFRVQFRLESQGKVCYGQYANAFACLVE